ncbi:MAG: hypothetical protein ACRDNP_08650 [Gaiellaceae bacterium]
MIIGLITALLWVPLAVSQDLPLWTVLVGVMFAFLFGSREERRRKRREHERLAVEAEPWEEEPFEDRATPPPILYV